MELLRVMPPPWMGWKARTVLWSTTGSTITTLLWKMATATAWRLFLLTIVSRAASLVTPRLLLYVLSMSQKTKQNKTRPPLPTLLLLLLLPRTQAMNALLRKMTRRKRVDTKAPSVLPTPLLEKRGFRVLSLALGWTEASYCEDIASTLKELLWKVRTIIHWKQVLVVVESRMESMSPPAAPLSLTLASASLSPCLASRALSSAFLATLKPECQWRCLVRELLLLVRQAVSAVAALEGRLGAFPLLPLLLRLLRLPHQLSCRAVIAQLHPRQSALSLIILVAIYRCFLYRRLLPCKFNPCNIFCDFFTFIQKYNSNFFSNINCNNCFSLLNSSPAASLPSTLSSSATARRALISALISPSLREIISGIQSRMESLLLVLSTAGMVIPRSFVPHTKSEILSALKKKRKEERKQKKEEKRKLREENEKNKQQKQQKQQKQKKQAKEKRSEKEKEEEEEDSSSGDSSEEENNATTTSSSSLRMPRHLRRQQRRSHRFQLLLQENKAQSSSNGSDSTSVCTSTTTSLTSAEAISEVKHQEDDDHKEEAKEKAESKQSQQQQKKTTSPKGSPKLRSITLRPSSSSSCPAFHTGYTSVFEQSLSIVVLSNDFLVLHPQNTTFALRTSLAADQPGSFSYTVFDCKCNVEDIKLSADSIRLMQMPNAGGNSLHSELMSFEVLQRTFGAKLLLTEMEIEYWYDGSKRTDYSVLLYGRKIGVSVTRAMKYKGVFTSEDAIHLLTKKLYGIIVSTTNVITAHSWEKQILHIWVAEEYIARIVEQEFHKMSDGYRHNTIVIITISKGAPWLYASYCPALPTIDQTLVLSPNNSPNHSSSTAATKTIK
eukprot:TRINITY_DN350_c0_g1_i6.p1 TRINITY_DN350_c0_g1~~TRINITY_DN350_c0_g1_i6.p1  ORF type:complete len:835 (+),score=160.60 TRINITY_DN350_c0_g1_i6:3033-5537(+)